MLAKGIDVRPASTGPHAPCLNVARSALYAPQTVFRIRRKESAMGDRTVRKVEKARKAQGNVGQFGRTGPPPVEEGPDALGRVFRISGAARPTLKRFDRAMKAYMKQNNLRGGALAVVKDGRLVLAHGYTFATPNTPQVQPDSVFRIASASKPITAVGSTS